MDRFESMRTFQRVAELGSFSAVAAQLGIARSVVTRQVAALEAHLGAKLMVRSTRRLSLTSAGTAYLEKCRVILNLVEAAETDVAAERAQVRGSLRIGLPLIFGLRRLAPLLLEFAQRHARLSLEMDYTDRRVDLAEEGFDLSIRITGQPADDDIVRRLGSVRLVAIASPAYLAQHGRPGEPAELAGHECLLYSGGPDSDHWPFAAAGGLARVAVRGRFRANNGEALVQAAARGLGIALQPDFIVEDALRRGEVEEILAGHPSPELGIYALLPGTRHMPYRVRALIEFLAERLQHAGPTLARAPAPP